MAGYAFDPASKFKDQSPEQLQDGIAKARSEIDSINKDNEFSAGEFVYDQNAVKAASLQMDIEAMSHALARKTGVEGENWFESAIHGIGARLATEGEQAQKNIDITMGRTPPAPPIGVQWPSGLGGNQEIPTGAQPQPLDPFFEQSVPGKVAQMVGPLAGQTAMTLATGGGALAEIASFAGMNFEGRVEEARAEGKSLPEQVALGDMAAAYAPAQVLAFRNVLGPLLKCKRSHCWRSFKKPR